MACAVFFADKSYVMLDLTADEVGERLRGASTLERFENKKGQPIWINPANVCWIESRDKVGAAVS